MSKPFDYWLKRNRYYHQRLIKFFTFAVPKHSTVLHINCKNGYLLENLDPSLGVGVDEDSESIRTAQSKYPQYSFYQGGIESIQTQDKFDYIILSSITMETDDIQELFEKLHKFCHKGTRIFQVLRLDFLLSISYSLQVRNSHIAFGLRRIEPKGSIV